MKFCFSLVKLLLCNVLLYKKTCNSYCTSPQNWFGNWFEKRLIQFEMIALFIIMINGIHLSCSQIDKYKFSIEKEIYLCIYRAWYFVNLMWRNISVIMSRLTILVKDKLSVFVCWRSPYEQVNFTKSYQLQRDISSVFFY